MSRAPHESKNPLAQMLLSMSGPDAVITVHHQFVKFTGSLEGGMLLSQLLYWTERSKMGGWVAKSDPDFADELCLSRYSVRQARDRLIEMGILETKIKRFAGLRTLHYRVNVAVLKTAWAEFLSRSRENERPAEDDRFGREIEGADHADSKRRSSEIKRHGRLKTKRRSSESARPLTETTAESTDVVIPSDSDAESEAAAAKDAAARAAPASSLQEYPVEWVEEAFQKAERKHAANPAAYVRATLEAWKREGHGARRRKRGTSKAIEYVASEDLEMDQNLRLIRPPDRRTTEDKIAAFLTDEGQ